MRYVLFVLLSAAVTFNVSGNTLSQIKNPDTIFVVVHGTWAKNEDWHTADGNFYQALSSTLAHFNTQVVDFLWSGDMDEESREMAGTELAEFIKSLAGQGKKICIVAHSHGANVCIIASKILGKASHSKPLIDRFYSLAAPIDNECFPDMSVISCLYNMFSIGDFVQPVFGIYDRTYEPHENIVNLRVIIEDLSPGHADMHTPLLGLWIPLIHSYLSEKSVGGFENFTFSKDFLVNFYYEKEPVCSEDKNLESILENEKLDLHSLAEGFIHPTKSTKLLVKRDQSRTFQALINFDKEKCLKHQKAYQTVEPLSLQRPANH